MASLIKSQGLYYLQFYSKNRKPQRKQVPLNVSDKRAAERLKVDLESKYALGQLDPWVTTDWHPTDTEVQKVVLTLSEAIDLFFDKKTNLRPKGRRAYSIPLRGFRDFSSKRLTVSQVTPEHIRQWLDTTSTNDVSRANYVRHLKSFFNFLAARGYVETNPVRQVALGKIPKRFPKFLTEEEVQHIVSKIQENTEKKYVPSDSFFWLSDTIRINVYLGLRAGELCNLRWNHVNFERHELIVRNTEEFSTKSGEERIIPIADEPYRLLSGLDSKRVDRTRDDYVFKTSPTAGKMCQAMLSRRFKRFAKDAGLSQHCFHSTRHTAASWLAMRGVQVEAIRQYMGHSSIEVTQKYMCYVPNVYHNIIRNAFNMTTEEVTHPTSALLRLVDIRNLPIPSTAERESVLKAA